MTTPTMKMFQIVPEDIVRESATNLREACPDEEENSFEKMLKVAQEWRDANCTPIFITDHTRTMLYCACKETLGKKLH